MSNLLNRCRVILIIQFILLLFIGCSTEKDVIEKSLCSGEKDTSRWLYGPYNNSLSYMMIENLKNQDNQNYVDSNFWTNTKYLLDKNKKLITIMYSKNGYILKVFDELDNCYLTPNDFLERKVGNIPFNEVLNSVKDLSTIKKSYLTIN